MCVGVSAREDERADLRFVFFVLPRSGRVARMHMQFSTLTSRLIPWVKTGLARGALRPAKGPRRERPLGRRAQGALT